MATFPVTSSLCAETDSTNTNQNTTNSLDVGGFSSSNPKENEAFVFFNVSGLPSGAAISKAVLELAQFSGSYWKKENRIYCAPCTSYMSNTSITWNSKPGTGAPSAYLDISENAAATRTWTISAEGLENYIFNGYMILKFWGQNSTNTSEDAKGFRPSTYSDTDKRPKLTLTYETGHLNVNVGGNWRTGTVYYNQQGTWKKAKGVYYNQQGTWKQSTL